MPIDPKHAMAFEAARDAWEQCEGWNDDDRLGAACEAYHSVYEKIKPEQPICAPKQTDGLVERMEDRVSESLIASPNNYSEQCYRRAMREAIAIVKSHAAKAEQVPCRHVVPDMALILADSLKASNPEAFKLMKPTDCIKAAKSVQTMRPVTPAKEQWAKDAVFLAEKHALDAALCKGEQPISLSAEEVERVARAIEYVVPDGVSSLSELQARAAIATITSKVQL